MKLEPRKQKTPTIQKSADDFMKDSTHQDHAQVLVKRDIEELRDMGKTREEIIEDRAKKGFLKTEVDRKILEGELKKAKVKENPELYRQRKEKKAREQTMVNYFIRQGEIEGRKEAERKRKPKKYF